jgi:rRNA-processing protein FCF1
MKIVVDTSVLIFMVDRHAPAPIDRHTGKAVLHCRERIEGLIEGLDEAAAVLIVPTPVLSELLICSDTRQPEVLAALTGKRTVQVASFDQMAAVENAQLRRSKINGRKRGETKKEVSFDLQILAIARANQADLVLTDDENLRKRCDRAGVKAMGIAELSLPDSKRQISMLRELEGDDEQPEPGESD